MAAAADKKRWDDLHAALAKADAATEEFERGLRAKYGMNFQRSWLARGQQTKLDQLHERANKIGGKIFELLERISPRDWTRGVSSRWVIRELTWEDAIRPKGEPLSVVVPGAYGYPYGYVKEARADDLSVPLEDDALLIVDPYPLADSVNYPLGRGVVPLQSAERWLSQTLGTDVRLQHHHGDRFTAWINGVQQRDLVEIKMRMSRKRSAQAVGRGHNERTSAMPRGRQVRSRRQPSLPGFPDTPEALEIEIPNMPKWQQIGGDMSPGAYGGIIARSDGDALELIEIQPVREAIGDREAAEVGFPFWTREAHYDLADLDPSKPDVQSALRSYGLDANTLEDLKPAERALAIAEALLSHGDGVDEGPSGWSDDIVPGPVKWMSGKIAGPEYLADEDDEFIHDVLLADLEVDYEKYGPHEDEPESGLKVFVSGAGTVEITEWTDIEAANGEEQPEGEKIVRQTAEVDLDELFNPKGKHRGMYSGDSRDVSLHELADMDDEDREKAVVAAAIAYIGYYGGTEEYVDAIGD